jgi:hypothetical protein
VAVYCFTRLIQPGDDPFDEWLKERGREVYHFEPDQTLEEDEEVFEAEVG